LCYLTDLSNGVHELCYLTDRDGRAVWRGQATGLAFLQRNLVKVVDFGQAVHLDGDCGVLNRRRYASSTSPGPKLDVFSSLVQRAFSYACEGIMYARLTLVSPPVAQWNPCVHGTGGDQAVLRRQGGHVVRGRDAVPAALQPHALLGRRGASTKTLRLSLSLRRSL
jgi:hypothetical protein